jgi:ketosteroid isomerase-like protein
VAAIMVTIGRGVLAPAVHELFEGLRGYDAARAAKVLAADADWESPWTGGKIVGRDAIQKVLDPWLKDPQKRPSFSIVDVEGDGAVNRLRLSVSGRFGQAPQRVVLHALCLKGQVHHVKVVPEGAAGGHH